MRTFYKSLIALALIGLSAGAAKTSAQTWNIGSPNAADVTATISGTSPNYTLTISGTGAMQDFLPTDAPWVSEVANITSLVINEGITSIGKYDFWSCYRVEGALTLPSTLTSIGSSAFDGCMALTSVNIPNLVSSIGKQAFVNCSSLTAFNVDVGNSYYSSDNGILFNNDKSTIVCCPGAKSGDYVIPTLVTYIGNSAFSGCIYLTSITIPNTVTSIGMAAFMNCYRLTSVTCLNTDPANNITMGLYVFAGADIVANACILYVPAGSEALYQTADQWEDFYPNIVGITSGIKNVETPNLKLYPNPVQDELYITDESSIIKVEIYNSNGKMVMQEKNFAGEMNVSSFVKGLYMVRVYSVQGTATVKIIKN